MANPVTKSKEDLIRELKQKKLQQLKVLRDVEESNRIKYFGMVDESVARRHAKCCKIGKGPNPLQDKLLQAWDNPTFKVFTYCGANRIGKTTIWAVIATCLMPGEWLWNGVPMRLSHRKARKIRVVGQDWEKHIKTVVEPALHWWWPKERPVTIKKNNQGIDAFWTDEKTGSTIEIMSNNQEADLFEGWDGDLVIYDEPPRREVRVACARGLIDRKGRELFCMTLLKEAWVDREVIKARNEDGTPDTTVFNISGDISVNVGYGIDQEGVDQFAKTLTEEEKDARLKGIPSHMSGLVYPTFKRETHLRKRFKIPLDWIVDISIDIHPRERQAVLFVATDPRNYRYVCFEIWEHGDGTAIAEEIVRIVRSYSLRVGSVLIDPLSKADSNIDKEEVADILEGTTYRKVEKVLNEHDIPLEAAVKAKTSGILAVRNHLVGPNNDPSLFFFDDLKRVTWEIEGYMYDEDTQKPLDKDDHMMENLYRIILKDTQWEPVNTHRPSKPKSWKVV